jgi:DNA-binding NarL/FixJ family response regulator
MRVLIADDNPLVRSGIARLLSGDEDLQVCREASDSNETLQKAGELEPDLVLLDVSMPGMKGLDTARLLRERVPAVKKPCKERLGIVIGQLKDRRLWKVLNLGPARLVAAVHLQIIIIQWGTLPLS